MPDPSAAPLDASLVTPWDSVTVTAVQAFKLGDLIADVPLHYVRRESERLWESASTDPTIGSLAHATSGRLPSYAIITTQTCDLVDEGGDCDQPWFQVSPVLRYESENDVPRRDYLHKLTAQPHITGTWVADLRIDVPLEKTILRDRTPIPGFSNEDDELDFASHLGRRRDRAALADGINRCMYRTFAKKLSRNKNLGHRVKPALYAVGLAVEQGTRVDPKSVEVHFVGAGSPPAGDVLKWLESWWDEARNSAAAFSRPFELLANQYHGSGAMDLAVYDDLIVLSWL